MLFSGPQRVSAPCSSLSATPLATRNWRCMGGLALSVHEHVPRRPVGGGTLTHLSGGCSPAVAHAASQPWMTVKPADSQESPFAELDLMELWDGTGKTRVRQHVNPLRRDFQTPPPPPDWAAVFADPSLPLALDIGSGYGRFLLLLQRNNPERRTNYLGVEIRRPLVDRSNEWAARLGVADRVHYVFANATVSLDSLLAGYPGPVTDVFIQFPDPHFKRRHHKRRVVQPQLVAAVRDLMAPGGRLLLQSDVEEVTVAMRNTFERHAGEAFELAPEHRERPVFFSRPMGQDPQPALPAPHAHAAAEGAQPAAGACAGIDADGSHPAPSTSILSSSAAGSEQWLAACASAVTRPPQGSPHGPLVAAAGDACCCEGSGQRSAAAHAVGMHAAGDGAEFGGGSGSGSDDTLVSSDTEADSGSDGDGDDTDTENMVSEWAAGGWLLDNPVGTPTEREHYVGQQGLPVYRVLLVRR